MTQDEIIRMARELASRHGSRMCDENGETHGEELYCVGVEDIAEIIKQVAAHEREKQVEQEPVAWMHTFAGDVQINNLPAECYGDHWTRIPLYTRPVRTKDLTDDEIFNLNECESSADIAFARAVIAADRKLNK